MPKDCLRCPRATLLLSILPASSAVEMRVRKLAGLGNEAYGVDLMKKAFGTTGRLTDGIGRPG